MIRFTLLAVLCGAACGAWAATPIDQTHPLDARGELHVDNVKGRIHVRVWDREEVRLEGSLGAGVEKLEVSGDRSDLHIRVRYPNRGSGLGVFTGSDRSEPTELRLTVPRRVALALQSVSADIDVEGVAGRELDIETVSGDVLAIGAPGDAGIDSVSGDVTATLNSTDVDIDTVSGDVVLRGRLTGEIGVETVSGNVEIGVHSQSVVRRVSGNAVSGDIRVQAALAPGGEMGFESVSGDIDLQLPASTSARVKASTFNGDLSAPGARIEKPEHGPGRSLDHRYGAGDGEIEIETFSGDARVRIE